MSQFNYDLKFFVLCGLFGALTFGLAFLLGFGIILATGIPATGGIINILVCVAVVVVGAKVVSKFGFGILTLTIVFTLAIPTLIGGPPGIYKVVNGFLIGLTFDLIVFFGMRKRLAYIFAGSVAAVVSILSIFGALVLLGLPGVSKLQPLLLPLTLVQAVTGALGAWLGMTIFEKRLQKLTAIRNLMDNVEN